MSKPNVFPSPNKKNKAVLAPIGEVQEDHRYYSLSFDRLPHSFIGRIFGPICLWSPDSRFFVVQEWKETDEAGVPKICQLLIIDTLTRRECVIANVSRAHGNILPESFIGDSLMYTVIYYGQFGTTKSVESRFQHLSGWQTIK